MRKILKIVFIIIGIIVGAGFASGKEIYSFFFIYGKTGVFGIILSSILIGLVVYKTLKICDENRINNYQEFCNYVENKVLNKRRVNNRKCTISKVFSGLVNLFLLIMFYVMISGFSSFLYQEFNINKMVGSIIIIVLCYLTFIGNMDKLMKVNNYLMPVLILFIFYVSAKSLICENANNYIEIKFINNSLFEFKGIVKSILYACYNCLIMIPVLVQLNYSEKKNERGKLYISIISSIIICALSFSVYNLLLQGDFEVFKQDMPIITITKQFGSVCGLIYTIIIGIAIFTSAASSGIRLPKQLQ